MKHLTGTVESEITSPVYDDLSELSDLSISPMIPEIATESLTNIFSILKKSDGSPLLDKNQILDLLKFKIGDERLLNLEHRYFVYEIVNLLYTLPYTEVYNFLNARKKYRNRLQILSETPSLQQARDKLEKQLDIFGTKEDVGTGIFTCRKCGSDETISKSKQTRGGDEMTSVFVHCTQCNHKWAAQ